MFPSNVDSTSRKKSFPGRGLAVGILVVLGSMGVLWALPFTRLVILSRLAPPVKISVPTLSASDAITPGTVENVQLLDHWGNGNFSSMAWSPDGRTFAILTNLGLNLYDGESFELLQTIHLPAYWSSLPSFSPDGSRLALTDENGNISLLDLRENGLLQQWVMDSRISLLTFLQDDTLLCVTETGDVLRLVDGEWQHVTSLKDGFLTDASFLPEQQALLAVYADSTQLIDPYTGNNRKLPFVGPYGGDVLMYENNRVEVNRDLSLVSSYTRDTLINQVTLQEGEMFRLLTLSPQGDIMATLITDPSSSQAGTVTFWQIPTLERIRSFPIPEATLDVDYEIAFSPDGEKLAVLDEPYLVKIFPVRKGSASEITISDPFAGVEDIGVSPQGQLWSVHCTGTSVEIREGISGEIIDAWHFDQPHCGRLLADGKSVAISTSSGEARIYKIGENTMPIPVNAPYCNLYSADGSACVNSQIRNSSGDPIGVGIWQQKFGLYQSWKDYQDESSGFEVAISPSGQYAAASSREKTHLFVRGVKTGPNYRRLEGKLAFSPDERSLASNFLILNLDTADVIKLEGSRKLQSGPAHYCPPEFTSLPTYSPDGQILAYAACGKLFFWRASDGSLLAKTNDPYFSDELQFSPDGTFLLAEGTGNASVWGIPGNTP
jgi:WD40 repeat protein